MWTLFAPTMDACYGSQAAHSLARGPFHKGRNLRNACFGHGNKGRSYPTPGIALHKPARPKPDSWLLLDVKDRTVNRDDEAYGPASALHGQRVASQGLVCGNTRIVVVHHDDGGRGASALVLLPMSLGGVLLSVITVILEDVRVVLVESDGVPGVAIAHIDTRKILVAQRPHPAGCGDHRRQECKNPSARSHK
jgi:hypothetical protein